MSTKSRAVSAKGVEEYKTYITRSIPVSAVITCADNTGAKTLRVVQVTRAKTRLKRVPAASVGDHIVCVVKRGPPDLRKQTFGAVIVRQKYPVRRVSGLRISFEDNAAVIVTPEGELKGTDIKGPVASEAAERWPRIANLASIII
ncbi:MAG: 50S ribosomal protein L14 [Thaumarchaeota archaeon]|nr:MAG: 50S ribosomal protein L14 [Nitrososphaerota archaeon]TLY13192.1 MAG: 50S ribosomal protein L14 [Nitrososphaerota archaeon]HLQ03466.1 50S ribosomal protein L14 [Nitrososphaerales archaeon]HLQ21416.1 50S ribosomal protein L14 [Nitrososphaerales archaeon]